MTKLRFLITAGPTVEPIDPVRFLSNRSSGKMGYALAKAALKEGHSVTLVSGPTYLIPPEDSELIAVETAREMEKAVIRCAKTANVIIKTAAVADFRPVKMAKHKIKKRSASLFIRLVPNPDILKKLGRTKRKNQILVGFAAETRDLIKNSLKKIREKNLDWIVVNDVSRKDIAFGSDNNAATLIDRDGKKVKLPKQSKERLAETLIRTIVSAMASK